MAFSTPMERLKMTLLKVFRNEKLSPKDLELLENHVVEQGVTLEDIPTEELLGVTISFVKAFGGSKADVDSYASRVLDLNVFEREEYCVPSEMGIFAPGSLAREAGRTPYNFDPRRVHESILNRAYNRSDMIYLVGKVRSFRFDFVDWSDREFLVEIIKYTFYRSLLMLRSITNEESLEQCNGSYQETPQMQAYVLASCGHINPVYDERRKMLRRRIEPVMSLDDYAKTILKDMKKREELSSKNSENSRVEHPREDMDDYKRNFRGNTKNVG